VFGQVRQALLDPHQLLAGERAVLTGAPDENQLIAGQLKRLDTAIDAKQSERARLLDAYQAGLLHLDELTRRTSALTARHGRLIQEKETLTTRNVELSTQNRLRRRLAGFSERVAASLDDLDFDGRQRLLRLVVEHVRVSGWRVEIPLKIPLPNEPTDDDPPGHGPPPGPTDRSPVQRAPCRCQPMCACVPFMRNAWDGKPLQTIAKNAPARATDAHIAIIGHVTKDELLRFRLGTELANGFVNRFLLVGVRRSQELPFGGRLDGEELERVGDATLIALRFASQPRELTFDPQARERWIEVYGPVSRGEEGLLGAATRRAEAHVVRLAAIYCAEQIALAHLEAALAVWRYSLDSARWIFGDSLGDPAADEIWALAKDRPDGVTRSELRDLFSRNKKAREIDRALTVLEEAGRLTRTSESDGRGRPAEIWLPRAA
jgi:hypothetical protein